MKKITIVIFLTVLICNIAGAQTVTVNSLGGADYTSINAAYAAVKANPAVPDIIQIIGGGPYNESLLINTSVVIKGEGYVPVIVTPPTSGAPHSSLNDNGIAIYTDSSSGGDIVVRLENLIIIPDASNPPTRGIRSNNNASGLSTDNMEVQLVNVLITSNNGANVPVSLDGLSQADLTGATTFGDDHMFFTGYVDVYTTGVISTCNFGHTASADGLVFYPDDAGRHLYIGPGSVFSFMNRIGIQVASDGSIVRMKGTKSAPILIMGNWASQTYAYPNGGLAIYHDCNGNPDYNYEMDWVFIINNFNSGTISYYADAGEGLPPITMNHCIIANNQHNGLWVGDDLLYNWVLNNCTIANNGLAAEDQGYGAVIVSEETAGGTTGGVIFNDTIIAGKGSSDTTNGNNTIQVTAANATVQLNYSAKVLGGPYKLGGNGYTLDTGVPSPTENHVITADPQFVEILNFASPDYFDVASQAYYGQGSSGSNLSGAMDYVGGIPTAVGNSWMLYQ